MGKCNSKPKDQPKKVDVTKVNLGSEEIKTQVNDIPAVVKSNHVVNPTVQKISMHKLQFTIGADKLVHEGTYAGNKPLVSITNEFRQNLEPGCDYDFYLVNSTTNTREDISKKISENVSSFFTTGVAGEDTESQVRVIELVYSGLAVSPDTRKAYAESTQVVASPKYDSNPFEIISFNKTTNGLSYQLYQDESFDYLKTFNEFSAYCNGNNKLYLSGSDKKNDEDSYNNLFIEIDLANMSNPNHIKTLPNLLTGRSWHSMIFVPPRYVFIVGGLNTKSVELYNTEKNEITHDSNLNENRSEVSICCVNNTHLYAFCGFLLNNNYLSSFEKCNLKAKTRQWEMVNLITGQNCSFEPNFFSVAFGKGNSIILLGGKESEKSNASKNYIFESKNGVDTIDNYQLNPVDDFFLCSEKFFMPINEKASILMPVYTSDVVKILHFDSDAGSLNVIKFEMMENTEDEIRNSLTFQAADKFAKNDQHPANAYSDVHGRNNEMNMKQN
jgi:hypothetical protein